MAVRRRTSERTAVLPARRRTTELGRLAPSGRSLLLGIALLALAAGAYAGARETSVFAVRTIEVRGGTGALQRQVEQALAGEQGRSLLRVDGGSIDSALAALPGVKSFSYDRSFPHTLRIVVRPEDPVLLLRQGSAAFLVAASGRVLRPIAHPRLSSLPRLWVSHDVALRVGGRLAPETASAAAALGALESAPIPGGVREVRAGKELTLVLGRGLELRLGDAGDLRLKLAIARRILRVTGAAAAGAGYLDVSVPERPVLFGNTQVPG